jgi:hypothetical protein
MRPSPHQANLSTEPAPSGVHSDHSNDMVDDDQHCLSSQNGVNKRKLNSTVPTTNNKKFDFETVTEIPPTVRPGYFVGNIPEWFLIRLKGGILELILPVVTLTFSSINLTSSSPFAP